MGAWGTLRHPEALMWSDSAGRIIFARGQGKLIFYTLRGAGQEIQIMCSSR